MDEKEHTRELVVVDVRHYKKVKKALHESEDRYRQLFENVPIGIYRTTPDGRIVDANPAFVKMAGFVSFAEMVQLNLNKEYSKAGHERADFIKRLERDGEVKGLESIWKTRDGYEIHVRENAKLVHGENGEMFFEGTVEDITVSKQAETAQKLRTQQLEIINRIVSSGNTADSLEELLDSILDNVLKPLDFSMAGIFMYDPEAKKMRVMASRGLPKSFFLNSKDMAIESMPFSQVLLQGQPVFVDDTGESMPDLTRKWKWKMVGSVPMLSKGRVVGAINVASCDRKVFSPEEKNILELIGKESGTLISKLETEKALRESEKYYRTLIDMSPDIICVLDLEANLTMINQRFLQIGGYFYDEVIGHNVLEFVQELKLKFLLAGIKKFLKTKKLDPVEYPIKKKDGTIFPMEMAISLLTNDKGKPTGIMGVGRDITKRKQAEQELRESKALIDAVVENVPLMIFIKEATDLRFVIFNRAGEELLGYDRKNLLGKNNLDLFPAEQAAFFLAKDREVLDRGADMLDIPEEPIMTAKKGQRLLHTRKVCIRGADGTTKYLLGISEDITERKEAEAKLLEYQEQLRALTSEMILIEEKERRRIASELHDQIGQNLALCKLKVAALEKNLGDEAIKVELAVVRRLLECSIQDARSLIFDLSPPVLYELGFTAALEWLAERMQEQFHIPVEFENRLRNPELKNDQQVILFQVVRELLMNVGKHSRAGQAKIILAHDGPFLKIQVNDDGVGFDASRIFAPQGQHNGFGFFSMRERLNYLGGSLDVRSKPGHGSQIILKITQQGGGAAVGKEKS
jgi:PAS domain S-box-containing protein